VEVIMGNYICKILSCVWNNLLLLVEGLYIYEIMNHIYVSSNVDGEFQVTVRLHHFTGRKFNWTLIVFMKRSMIL
jgi:hypothetical protein